MKNFSILFILFFLAHSLFAQSAYPLLLNNSGINQNTNAVLTIDYDLDGDLDILIAAQDYQQVYLSENTGNIEDFPTPVLIVDLEINPDRRFGVGDFNGDNVMEVLLGGEDEIYIYENNLTNELSSILISINLPYEVEITEVKDMNGDGMADVFIAGEGGAGYYEGINGAEMIGEYIPLTTENLTTPNFNINEAALGDLDSDGDTDFVIMDFVSGQLGWFENIENTSFSTFQPIGEYDDGVGDIYLIDYDADGDKDVIIRPSDEFNDPMLKFDNFGDGNFSESIFLIENESSGHRPRPIFTDFNDDGYLDMAAIRGGLIILYLYDESLNSHVYWKSIVSASNNATLLKADLDLDGIEDLITHGSILFGQHLAVYRGKNLAEWYNPVNVGGVGANSSTIKMQAVDLNSDGKYEIIKGKDYGGQSSWYEFDDDSHLLGNTHYLPVNNIDGRSFHVQDFNLDGFEDILVRGEDYTTSHLQVLYRETEEIEYEDGISLLEAEEIYDAHLMYLNDDSRLDIVYSLWDNENPNSGLGYLLSDTSESGFSVEIPIESNSNIYQTLALLDVTGDGREDIIAQAEEDLTQIVYLAKSMSGGGFETEEILATGLNYPLRDFIDFNGDGHKDFLLYSEDMENIAWVSNLGNGEVGEQILIAQTTDNLSRIIVDDFDIDGNQDILIRKTPSFEGNRWFWYRNTGAGNFTELLPFPIDFSSASQFLIRDFDNDGDTDIITNSNASISINSIFLYDNLINPPAIQGKFFLDENENGINDLGEIPLYLQNLTVEPQEDVYYSSPEGNIFIPAGPGEYTMTGSGQTGFELTTPASVDVEILPDSDEVIQVDFGLRTDEEILDGLVSLASAPTRCGFEVPFWIEYRNTGTISTDGLISLTIDPLATFVSASITPDDITGNVLQWSINNLPPTHHAQIMVLLQMPSVEYLGETVDFTTTFDMTTENGLSNLEETLLSSIINCAYDPNDKQVQPSIANYDNYTFFGDTLEYTIRFQNTGTDTAFTVRVADNLDENFDYETLEIIGASHHFATEFNLNSGRLVFTFDDILLPDSLVNEPLSHGYVRFRLQHKTGLMEQSLLTNFAEIFFDFNPPIVTNEVQNILISDIEPLFDIQSPFCFGDSTGSIINLNTVPIFTDFNWSNGTTASYLTGLNAGIYNLTITRFDGLIIDTMFTVAQPEELMVDIITFPENNNNSNGSISLGIGGGTPPYTVMWEDFSNINDAVLNDLMTGLYEATISDANGCVNTIEAEVDFVSAMNELNKQHKFKVLPNPSSGPIIISNEENFTPGTTLLKIVDDSGKETDRRSIDFSCSRDVRIDLPSGSYHLIFSGDFGTEILQVIITQ